MNGSDRQTYGQNEYSIRQMPVYQIIGYGRTDRIPIAMIALMQLLLLLAVSQKNTCQHIFCSLLVKYKPISLKIDRLVPEETLNKTV